MGHKHQWCSYPPEGEVRRRKTWDELEGDEEEMVTNARVLEYRGSLTQDQTGPRI